VPSGPSGGAHRRAIQEAAGEISQHGVQPGEVAVDGTVDKGASPAVDAEAGAAAGALPALAGVCGQ
jgi:hypothetical protein